ncbi:DUF4162 domain-containing protein [Staphylococcus pseudintermedius]|uniref:DUF4162 domain-containing protein n=1 Tax=Staphylococcus pseudintermedius TaxID=283734 RepID=UPI00387E056B
MIYQKLRHYQVYYIIKWLKLKTPSTVTDETVAEAIFEVVQQKGYAKRFQLMEPTMNEIFIEKVGD